MSSIIMIIFLYVHVLISGTISLELTQNITVDYILADHLKTNALTCGSYVIYLQFT